MSSNFNRWSTTCSRLLASGQENSESTWRELRFLKQSLIPPTLSRGLPRLRGLLSLRTCGASYRQCTPTQCAFDKPSLFLLITRSSLLRQTAPLRFMLVFSTRTQIAWFLKCRTPDAASVRKCASEFSNGCFKRKIRAQRGARVLASACTSAKSWLHERADKSGSRAPADKARYFQLHFQSSL